MPSLALVCNHVNVLIMVCHPFPSGVGSLFIGATSTTSSGGGNGGNDGGDGITNFSTFLFRTTGSGVLIAFSDCDLLRRL